MVSMLAAIDQPTTIWSICKDKRYIGPAEVLDVRAELRTKLPPAEVGQYMHTGRSGTPAAGLCLNGYLDSRNRSDIRIDDI